MLTISKLRIDFKYLKHCLKKNELLINLNTKKFVSLKRSLGLRQRTMYLQNFKVLCFFVGPSPIRHNIQNCQLY